MADPRDEAEAAALVAAAAAGGTTLAITGGGSKAAMGRPCDAPGALITRALTGITLHEPAELVLSARSGTPLAEVEELLARHGQMLPFEPPDYRALLGSGGAPTMGGLAGTNLSGPRRISAGACRDSLIGVRLVNGRGEVVVSGGRVMKNVTGLDLVKLACGSWGTLGLLTEVTFRLLPRPETARTLVLAGLDDATALRALSAALGSTFDVSGAAHLPGTPSRTVLRIEGFAASVTYRAAGLAKLLQGFGAAEELAEAEASALWSAVGNAEPLAEPQGAVVWRISTAPDRAAALVAGLGHRHFYDWGGGLVWLAVEGEADGGAAAVRAAVRRAGGHAMLVRAPEALRRAVEVFEPLPPAVAALTARIKASFDPGAILNPGRMYAGM